MPRQEYPIPLGLDVRRLLPVAVGLCLLASPAGPVPAAGDEEPAPRTVRARVQARPGGPVDEIEMAVHESPTELRLVAADEAPLEDGDLVLGVVTGGVAVAFPIRYLARYEIVNGEAGDVALAPSW
ncbi:MAG: DUF3179 domain-containing protein [Acidobacteria bacterium]|nr:MAG: DUF3179 domain-containing protein [Acidobacteriota bacterium]